jgi:hypothetical protein
MHELARHIIHSSEVLEAAVKTLLRMAEEHECFYRQDEEVKRLSSNSSIKPDLLRVPQHDLIRQVSSDLGFRAAFLQGLQLRSKSFEARLNNEIKLVCAVLFPLYSLA